jgi:hypothetical protein
MILVTSIAAWSEEKPVPVSYDLNVTIEPSQGTVAVHGILGVPVQADTKTLQFRLHETFTIKKLLINGHAAKFLFQPGDPSPIYPATRKVLVKLPPRVPGEKIPLEIEYGGRLKEIPEFGTFPDQKQALDDQINPRLVELANYSSWYPQFFVFGRPIEAKLEVFLPKGWIAICSGKKVDEREEDGSTVTRWASAQDTDILITAAQNYKGKVIPLADGQIDIYYTQLPEEFIDREGSEIAAVMDVFTRALGSTTIPSGAIKQVFSPKRKGQGRAGIARPGMIVTSEGLMLEALSKDLKASLLQDVAHEIAHFWWNFGAGQGDWINEAFAEYSSAVAVEQIVSEKQFQKVLEGYRSEVLQGIADAGLDPTDDGQRHVRCRGAGILSDLHGEGDWDGGVPEFLEAEAGG